MKPWYKSKTLWAMIITEVALLAATNIDKLKSLLPDNVYAIAAFTIPIIAAILRIITKEGVKLRG